MTSEKLLAIEIMLLLAKYGRKRVVTALAEHSELTEQEIEAELDAIRRRKLEPHQRGNRKRMNPDNCRAVIDKLMEQHPSKGNQIRTLFTRFQNRSFLPELKDVRDFLQRNAEKSPVLRSRSESTRHVFSTLASMDASELIRICAECDQPGRSALGVIADEILKKSG